MTARSAKGTEKAAPVVARPGSLVSAVERAGRAAGRRTPSDGAVGDDVREARMGLSAWLTAGREARGWSRDHVARVTRIPMRTLENLEDGRWDELPADVFVRGFLRGYARCVGLSVDDALAQYSGCGFAAAPVASAQARALLDSMAPLAPTAAAPRPANPTPITSQPRILSAQVDAVTPDAAAIAQAVETIALPEAPAPAKRTKKKRAAGVTGPSGDARLAKTPAQGAGVTGPSGDARLAKTPAQGATVVGGPERDARGRFVRRSVEMAAVAPPADLEPDAGASLEITIEPASSAELVTAAIAEAAPRSDEPTAEVAAAEAPAEPTPTVTRVFPPPAYATTTARTSAIRRAAAAPTLVIDDDDPDDAERAREQRAQQQKDGGWRSFLPPALLDQERGGRQGGLTLAVIILLIVATLTLSYLMRRPSSTGEGVTMVDVPSLRA